MITIDLEGQVAVLTGGSRGIGAATVRLLAQAGARVVFTYRRDRAAAARSLAAADAAAGAPGRVAALRADAARPAAAERLVAHAVRRFGRLDIAIANAGIWNAADLPIARLDARAWRAMLAANLDSAYALARAAARQLQRQPRPRTAPRGRIVLVASTAGQRGEAWHTHYGAAKGGVIAFVRGLAPELARQGILVNCVAPGWVDTDMARPAFRRHPERVFAAIPLGRPGKPEEIASCIVFLCTPGANFMTGAVLSVNGGAVLA
ncbi:MAG TPA: SDR family NAD(P)-dependent oxidoreductase [Terriglobales bacterium]|nr:SDR family NAD(P)-dependent oxidoreductase [Terriglobales bacterium]